MQLTADIHWLNFFGPGELGIKKWAPGFPGFNSCGQLPVRAIVVTHGNATKKSDAYASHFGRNIFGSPNLSQKLLISTDCGFLAVSSPVALGKRGREEKALGRAKHIAACFRELRKTQKRSAFCFLPDPWCVALGPHRGRLVDQEPIFSLLDGAEK